MDNKKYEDPWKCKVCGTFYVVSVLARDCEARHAGNNTKAATDKIKKIE